MAKRPRQAKGFDESQVAFGAGQTELGLVFAAYRFRCAFTGEDLRRLSKDDPQSAVVRLYGPRAPQYLHADLVIPAVPEIAEAFSQGHIAVGNSRSLLLDWSRIDHDLAARLNADGKLRLPTSEQFLPNAAALREHREVFASGAISAH